MPTYDYECEKCGYEFEEFQSITAPPITDCPRCKARNKVRRLIGSGAGIIFKGSGFYETDYRCDSYKKAAEADQPKTETKSDKKPEKTDAPKTADKPKTTPGALNKSDKPAT